MQELLTRSVCGWAGVPLPEAEVGRRAAELTALFDYAGSVGPKHWWSRLSRRRSESWIEGIVEQIRPGDLSPPRSEEHTSELQSLMRISYAVFCLKKKKSNKHQ